MKSSIRSGLLTERMRWAGAMRARAEPKKNAWLTSKKSGLTCVRLACGRRWKRPRGTHESYFKPQCAMSSRHDFFESKCEFFLVDSLVSSQYYGAAHSPNRQKNSATH